MKEWRMPQYCFCLSPFPGRPRTLLLDIHHQGSAFFGPPPVGQRRVCRYLLIGSQALWPCHRRLLRGGRRVASSLRICPPG